MAVLAQPDSRASRELDAIVCAELARVRALPEPEEHTFLSLFAHALDADGEPFSDAKLCDEMRSLLLAGHDSVAVSLAWTLEHVLRHPTAAAEIRAEQARGETRWVDAVAQEALRLHPPLPIVTRELTQPWSVGEFDLEAGTLLAPCLWLCHRDPAAFDDPLAFRAERFLDREPDTHAWLPFSAGVRRCVGAAFAELEMRLVLQRLLARTRLELVAPGVPERGRWRMIILSPGPTEAVLRERVDAPA
jgi:cytochrome P450